MVASSTLISCAKFEITTMNICQDIANFVFGQFWSNLSIAGVGWKCYPKHFGRKLHEMVASTTLISCAKFEITTMNICQDIAIYVFGQFWSNLSIAGVGWKCHPKHFGRKLHEMVASSTLISCAKFEITTMKICQDIANFVFGQFWSNLSIARVGWKSHQGVLFKV